MAKELRKTSGGVMTLFDLEFPTPNRDRMYKKITRTSDGKTGTVMGFTENGAVHVDWDDKTTALVPADVLAKGAYEISEDLGLACAREWQGPKKKAKLSDDPDDMPTETEEPNNKEEEDEV